MRGWLLVCAVMLGSACDTVVEGDESALRFMWGRNGTVIPPSFTAPVGVGWTAAVAVLPAKEGGATPRVLEATSDSDAVLKVLEVTEKDVVVQGVSAGEVILRVRTDVGSDNVVVNVAEVAKVDLKWALGSQLSKPNATVVAGSRLFLEAAPVTAGDKPTVGFGGGTVGVDPAGAIDWEPAQTRGVVEGVVKQAGAITLTAQGDEPLVVNALAVDALIGMNFKFSLPQGQTGLPLGQSLTLRLEGQGPEGELVLGVTSLAQVSVDEGPCTITSNRAVAFSLGEEVLSVTGSSLGGCTFTATLGAVTETLALTITEAAAKPE